MVFKNLVVLFTLLVAFQSACAWPYVFYDEEVDAIAKERWFPIVLADDSDAVKPRWILYDDFDGPAPANRAMPNKKRQPQNRWGWPLWYDDAEPHGNAHLRALKPKKAGRHPQERWIWYDDAEPHGAAAPRALKPKKAGRHPQERLGWWWYDDAEPHGAAAPRALKPKQGHSAQAMNKKLRYSKQGKRPDVLPKNRFDY